MLSKARILKASSAAGAAPAQAVHAAPAESSRIVPREIVDAHAAALEIRSRAQAEAKQQLSAVTSEKERIVSEARQAGYADGIAEATAACVALAQLEADKDARELDRNVELARLLAERLLGHALETTPDVVLALAKQALSEVRGAARIRMEVSPLDEAILTQNFSELNVTNAALELCVEPSLRAGDFRLQTNIGSLEASLGARLEVLCLKLREGLGS